MRRAAIIAIIGLLAFAGVLHAAAPNAVIVRDPTEANGGGGAEMLNVAITAGGYEAATIAPESLPDRLAADRPQLLVLANARNLPTSTAPALLAYLKQGGHLIACGLPAWDAMVTRVGDRWLTQADYDAAIAATKPAKVAIDFSAEDLAAWRRNANDLQSPTTFVRQPVDGRDVLHVTVSNLTNWETLSRSFATSPFPKDHVLTCFRARGNESTRQLAIEWQEKDGSRWIATVPQTTEWKDYALPPEAFHPWQPPKGRGGAGDRLRVENAALFSVGLAHSHTGIETGPHEYWLADVGTAPHPFPGVPEAKELPVLQTLSGRFMAYPITTTVAVRTPANQAIVSAVALPGTFRDLAATHPRPGGSGFEKGRDWRYQVLLEATDPAAGDDFRGAVATLLVNDNADFHDGVWAAFTPSDPAFYARPEVRRLITEVATAIRRGAFLKEAGTNFYTAFEDQTLKVGAHVASASDAEPTDLSLRTTIAPVHQPGKPVLTEESRVTPKPHAGARVSREWRPPAKWPHDGYVVTTELLQSGKPIDRITHALNVWVPPVIPHFIESRDGGFWLDGKPWKAHGVNYMPASGIGLTDNQLFEHWIGAKGYDPDIVDRDLRRIKAMGLNAVSVFVYDAHAGAQNMVDLLRRCRDLGLHANVSLRPGTPMDFHWPQVKQMIQSLRLAENDAVFAYDLAWEPAHGSPATQQQNYARLWRRWIDLRHGSVAKAEENWGLKLARDPEGRVRVPTGEQLTTDGPHRKLVADYRRFLDETLADAYGNARRSVRSIDPNHAVSFRMSVAGDPTANDPGMLFYDFPGLRDAVDVWEPEAYGRIGDWDRVKPGLFTKAYADFVDPTKPFLWAEVGVSTWDLLAMRPDPRKLEFQADYFRDFLTMATLSGADGLFYWWYPGGYRYNERSDFGILNPDGTDRPATRVIRDEGPKFLAAPKPKPYEIYLPVERDADARGLYGMYERVKSDYWKLTENGKRVGLKWAREPGSAPRPSK